MRCAGALATRVPDTLFDGPDGKTRNKTIQEKVVQNGDGYAYDQAGAHQRSPKIDIARDQKGRHPDTDGVLRGARNKGQRRNKLLHDQRQGKRSEEHTSELQSLMRTSYADFSLKQNRNT